MTNAVMCPVCNLKLVLRENAKGGEFLGCPNFQVHGCKVSWSRRDKRFYGLPNMSASASAKRGRALSQRDLTIAQVVVATGAPRDEVVSLIERDGLFAVQALFSHTA